MHRSPLARCTACRVSVLDMFTSLVAGVSIPISSPGRGMPTKTRPTLSASLVMRQSQQARAFSGRSARRQAQTQASSSAFTEPPTSSDQSTSSLPSSSTPPLPSSSVSVSLSSESIPWYLQIEDPTPPAPLSPLLALQEIPPLPSDPPAILQPVLEHLSVQIGLDNLVLLDLRHLDPPPALGANLIMVIGTARSVKHLNVSADRFCRWARKEYKLRPYADGLLGRNELKLKLRRKAKKLKLAQTVGNTLAGKDGDDGITTGWICVNMGAVDDAIVDAEGDGEQDVGMEAVAEEEEEEEEEYQNPPEEDSRYVGFGSRPNSPRIVVQMFTEEKRVEMDLEGLWDERNTRRQRREEKANAEAEAVVGRGKEEE